MAEGGADGFVGEFRHHEAEARLSIPPGPVRPELRDVVGSLVERRLRVGAGVDAGVAWLGFLSSLGLGAFLADEMALGKTVAAPGAGGIDRAGPPPGPTLLVCPMSMAGTWEEAGRFAPDLRLCAHHGPAPCSGATSCAAEEATVPRAGDPQPGDMEERVHRRGPVPPSR